MAPSVDNPDRPISRRSDRLEMPELRALTGRSIAEIEDRVSDLAQSSTTPLLSLTHADTLRFPPPPWFLDEIAAAVANGEDAFTPCKGDRKALELLAEPIGELIGADVDPHKNLALTPGTQGAMFAVLSAIVEPGDRVILVDPDYLTSERMVRYFGGVPDHIRLHREPDRSWIDLSELEEKMKRGARVMMFSHPNNPTGAVYDETLLTELAEMAAYHRTFIIVDELYCRLVYPPETFSHLAEQEPLTGQLATLLGPSKTESLSGFRIGAVVAPDWLTQRISRVLDITAIRAPAYSQHALARGWLTRDVEFVAERLQEFESLRAQTIEHLNQIEGLDLIPPQGTAYAFPDVTSFGVDDVAMAGLLMERAGVIVNPGIAFGPSSGGHFRICFAQDERRWSERLDRMSDIFDDIARRGSEAVVAGREH